jgi:hypothetical protein
VTTGESPSRPVAGRSRTDAGQDVVARAAPGAPIAGPPAPPASRGAGQFASLAEMPPAFQAAVPKLRVQVLVYDGNQAGAWVFINNRKYVAGDRLDDDIVLERITEEGAVLGFAGKRYLLKQ